MTLTVAAGAVAEVWQLHKSGAFMFAKRLEYVDNGGALVLPFEQVIINVALGVLFAQRLFQRLAPDGKLTYDVALLDTSGHRLGSYDHGRRLHGDYRGGEDAIHSRGTTDVLELRSAWRAVVHRIVTGLFVLFNWDISPVAIDQRLDEIEGKRRR